MTTDVVGSELIAINSKVITQKSKILVWDSVGFSLKKWCNMRVDYALGHQIRKKNLIKFDYLRRANCSKTISIIRSYIYFTISFEPENNQLVIVDTYFRLLKK